MKWRNSKLTILLLVVLAVSLGCWLASELRWPGKLTLGPVAEVTESSTGILFKARVDTGAAVSSVHCEQVLIEDESEVPRENRGKSVRFLVSNERDQSGWIETQIVDYSQIKSVDATTSRYYVRLLLICNGIEKPTLVTLNDRSHMRHKLLLGRDFLQEDFVVDVSP